MVRGNCVALCALAALVGFGSEARAQEPVMILAGDGLTMIIRQYDEDAGTASGELRLNGQVYPFNARLQETETGQNAQGQFVANGQPVAFQVRENAATGQVMFTTGNQTFRLREVDQIPPAPPQQPQPQPPVPPPAPQPPVPQPPAPPQPTEPQQPVNPLEGVSPAQPTPPAQPQPGNPLDGVQPVPAPTPQPPSNNPLDNVAAPNANAAATKRPAKAVFTLHKFPDVSMGGVTSHTVLLPEGWTADGKTEWSQGNVPWPQQMFKISSPDKGRFSTSASLFMLYFESHRQPGLPDLPPGGQKPPKDPAEWLLNTVGKSVTNMRITSAKRDPKIEAQEAQLAKQLNTNTMGAAIEHWVIQYEYDAEGIHRKEEVRLNYSCTPPIDNGNMNTWYWNVMPHYFVSAPADKFEQLKPDLLAVGATIRPTAKWFVHSQALLAELSRQRIANFAKAIADRARMYDQISNDQMASFRQRMKSMDKQQHEFVTNYIYERDDYTDTDGSIVNLPMHFNHVFSNGQGGYVLTNNSLDKPGANWTEIPAAPGIAGGG